MLAYAARTAARAWSLFVTLAKVMVPVFVLVRIAEVAGAVDTLGALAGPSMAPVGLPAELSIAWVAALLVGPPAAFAAMTVVAEPLTVAQTSTFATMMLIAHALPVESAIVARAQNADGRGRRFWPAFWANAALRLGGAYAFGVLAFAVFAATGWLSDPVDLSHLTGAAGEADERGWAEWTLGSAALFATILAIILALLVLLDAMERAGVTAVLKRLMRPTLGAAGVSERTIPLVTIGTLLGITYGAGLIIREVESGAIPPPERGPALAWLSLSHSVIEDTALMLVIAASMWVTLGARLAFTLVAVRALVWVLEGRRRATAPAP